LRQHIVACFCKDMFTSLSIHNFDYELPDSAVAKYPLPERDQSRLLLWQNKQIIDHHFYELPGLLPKGTMLVFNNTRVIKARLHFIKSTGAKIEVFCLEPNEPNDYVLSFSQTSSCKWICLVGNLKRWKTGLLQLPVEIDHQIITLKAEMIGVLEDGTEIEFSWNNPNYSFSEILEAAGNIPIPPYLHRESEAIDSIVYQTVYSKIKGSVAAPTAGLHFTERVFKALAKRDISCEELTLHVGAGTFQPVKSDIIGEHLMHTEHFSVSKEMIERLIAQKGKVIAIGTTSVRTLESLYRIGCKIHANPQIEPDQLSVTQWEPYAESDQNMEAKEALQAILDWLSGKGANTLETSTQIMIAPGYRFRIIDGLVTNFHQPQSTLLLLIAAILGEEWKRVYAHALSGGYRFLSYGDANLYLIQ
jgi:S-adenosylmethionine:tRNA ribosyltransferase-isomerase